MTYRTARLTLSSQSLGKFLDSLKSSQVKSSHESHPTPPIGSVKSRPSTVTLTQRALRFMSKPASCLAFAFSSAPFLFAWGSHLACGFNSKIAK